MSDGYFIPVKRESPDKRQHLHTLEGGARLPLAQTVGAGVIVFIAITILAYCFRWRDPLKWGAVTGSVAMLWTGYSIIRHWFNLTSLEKLETFTGMDLNKDHYVGKPPEDTKRIVTVQMVSADRRQWNTFDLPATEDQLKALATGLLRNTTLSERNWTGNGRPFSIQEFLDLRSEMLKRGLIMQINPKDPRQGFDLTEAGRQLMKYYNSQNLGQ